MFDLSSYLFEHTTKWPDSTERKRISRRMARQGFPGCIGFIDGTTFSLSQNPAVDGQCFFDRKHRYNVNTQVVCGDRRRIISFFSGRTGSCADNTAYNKMTLTTIGILQQQPVSASRFSRSGRQNPQHFSPVATNMIN